MEQELIVFDRGERPDYDVLKQLLNSLKNILTPVITQRRTSFTRNLRRATPIEQRQFLTFKLSIEKVQRDCAASLRLSKMF